VSTSPMVFEARSNTTEPASGSDKSLTKAKVLSGAKPVSVALEETAPSLSTSKTNAPSVDSRFAMARPKPCAAPVTTARRGSLLGGTPFEVLDGANIFSFSGRYSRQHGRHRFANALRSAARSVGKFLLGHCTGKLDFVNADRQCDQGRDDSGPN